jgi:superfamily II DNA or RNA helicase
MQIIIKTPTKAIIESSTAEEIEKLKKALTYTNSSVQFLLSKHRQNYRLKSSSPDYYYKQEKELLSQLRTCLLYRDREGNDWTFPGILPYLQSKFNIEIVRNEIVYPVFKPIEWKQKLEYTPYQYQLDSVSRFLTVKHGCVSLATGLGKSLILLMIARQVGDCVIITPSKSIFLELVTLFEDSLGKDKVGMFGDGKKDITKPITIAIGKSLTMIKKDTPEYDFFSKKKALAADESHSWSADTLEEVCHGVLSEVPYRFFASGTQISNNGKSILLNSVIGKCIYDKNIGDGIKEGYLCPLNFKILEVASSSRSTKKDPLVVKREHFLRNENIAKKIAEIANACWSIRGESTLILVEELVQIEMLAKYLKVPFGYAHSGSKKDAGEFGLETVKPHEQVLRFNMGEIKVLCGTRCVSTGTNIYAQSHCHNWVGGSSPIAVYQGGMGRNTRILANSKFKQYHKPRSCVYVYDYRIKGNELLNKHLEKRIECYEESCGTITYL